MFLPVVNGLFLPGRKGTESYRSSVVGDGLTVLALIEENVTLVLPLVSFTSYNMTVKYHLVLMKYYKLLYNVTCN